MDGHGLLGGRSEGEDEVERLEEPETGVDVEGESGELPFRPQGKAAGVDLAEGEVVGRVDVVVELAVLVGVAGDAGVDLDVLPVEGGHPHQGGEDEEEGEGGVTLWGVGRVHVATGPLFGARGGVVCGRRVGEAPRNGSRGLLGVAAMSMDGRGAVRVGS